MQNINPTSTAAWNALERHQATQKNVTIQDLFKQEQDRFGGYSLVFNDEILVDFSKNNITQKTLKLLRQLATECALPEAIEDMFKGAKINHTENRAVLHTALRNRANAPVLVDGRYNPSPLDFFSYLPLNPVKPFSKIRGKSSSFIPKPLSSIISLFFSKKILISPPVFVYLIALLKIYSNTNPSHFLLLITNVSCGT